MKKKLILFFSLAALLTFVISLFVGQYPIKLKDMLDSGSMSFKVFFNLRLPRCFMALISGAGLALAGYIFQTLFSNPIASPDIIGVSSGAATGAALAILLAGSNVLITACGAMAGGFLAVLTTIGLVKKSGSEKTTAFLLSGIIVNAITQALLMCIKLTADPERQLASIEYWTMGSFSAVALKQVLPVSILIFIGIIPLVLLSKTVSLLSLNTDEAQLLGVPVQKMRVIVLLLTTLVVTSITSITGLISFIGLLAPHGARLINKKSGKSTMILSMLLGSILVLVSDCFARSFGATELPISILTSFIGAPYLIFLMLKRGGRLD